MRLTKYLLAFGAVAAVSTAPAAHAADHLDGPAVQATPADAPTDINDVYTFMSGNNVVLAMTVFPAASNAAKFSDAAQYVFHVSSHAAFGMPEKKATNVICEFDAAQVATCWIGNPASGGDFITGDAKAETGITSTSGKTKLFAGLRHDPFFFFLSGFSATRTAALGAIPTLLTTAGAVTMAGCAQAAAGLAGGLTADMPTDNFFANLNTLAIVMEIDKSILLMDETDVLSIYGSTHAQP